MSFHFYHNRVEKEKSASQADAAKCAKLSNLFMTKTSTWFVSDSTEQVQEVGGNDETDESARYSLNWKRLCREKYSKYTEEQCCREQCNIRIGPENPASVGPQSSAL